MDARKNDPDTETSTQVSDSVVRMKMGEAGPLEVLRGSSIGRRGE